MAALRITSKQYKTARISASAVLLTCFFSMNVEAATLTPSGYRLSVASNKFDGVRQFSLTYKTRSPKPLAARHMELAVGTIADSRNMRVFLSMGPVWRLPIRGETTFVNLGFSPTIVAGSTFSNHDLGGNLHITSSLAVGVTVGNCEALTIALRIQHTSNGGINSTNPGLDMIGLEFDFAFARQ